jgi:hypothetical protein
LIDLCGRLPPHFIRILGTARCVRGVRMDREEFVVTTLP